MKLWLRPAGDLLVLALCDDLIAGRATVVWADGPDAESLVVKLAASYMIENPDVAAGVVLGQDGRLFEPYPWIHTDDKEEIITVVENGRVERGSWG